MYHERFLRHRLPNKFTFASFDRRLWETTLFYISNADMGCPTKYVESGNGRSCLKHIWRSSYQKYSSVAVDTILVCVLVRCGVFYVNIFFLSKYILSQLSLAFLSEKIIFLTLLKQFSFLMI